MKIKFLFNLIMLTLVTNIFANDKIDSRKLVDGAYDSFSRTVGVLHTFDDSSISHGEVSHNCTATAISPKHAITAASCIFYRNPWNENRYRLGKSIYFYPGRRGNNIPFGYYKVVSAYIPSKFDRNISNLDNSEIDIAVIELSTDQSGNTLKRYVGWISTWASEDYIGKVKMISYPIERNIKQYIQDCSVLSGSKNLFKIDCTVNRFEFGTAIHRLNPKVNEHHIIGVLSVGSRIDSRSPTDGSYYATTLNKNRVKIIDQIIAGTFSPSNNSSEEQWVRLRIE